MVPMRNILDQGRFMNHILEDFSARSLVAAIKSNQSAWFNYLGRSPKAERCDSPEFNWVLTGLTHPILNVVLRTELTPTNVDERIAGTLAYFRSRNVTQFAWWIDPSSHPADLGEHLLKHGLTSSDSGSGMAVDLLALNEDLASPSGLTIEVVGDEKTLEGFVHASFPSFGLLDIEENACSELLDSLGFEMPLRSYVGFLDGKPVATSQLFLDGGVAGIYWVATVPEARRQGIGAAVSLAALREARVMGYRIAVLGASPMGECLYRRLGFQEYCRMSNYMFVG